MGQDRDPLWLGKGRIVGQKLYLPVLIIATKVARAQPLHEGSVDKGLLADSRGHLCATGVLLHQGTPHPASTVDLPCPTVGFTPVCPNSNILAS